MSNFIPDLIVDTIYDISFEYLAEKKIKGIIFDLDNTMAGYSEALPNEKLVSWLENVSHAGFSIVIVSNNGKERVEK